MPGYFSIDDPSFHKTVSGPSWRKGEWYTAWHIGPTPEHNNLFGERDPARHKAMRRKVAPIYSMSSMVSYEPYVQNCIELLAKRLDEFSEAERTINVGEWMQYFAFDAITAITVRKDSGRQTSWFSVALFHFAHAPHSNNSFYTVW